MSGGGPSTQASDDPGFAGGILAPLMKSIGLGISARGGALGPMLASGGDMITQARDDRLKRDVYANILPGLLAGVTRSREIAPGKPGTPAVPGPPTEFPAAPETATPESEIAPAAETILPGTMGTPATPATPPVTRTWQTEPMLSEALQRLQGMPDLGANTKALALQHLTRFKLPTNEELPPEYATELADVRHRGYALTDQERARQNLLTDEQRHIQQRRDEEQRKAPIFQGAAPPGAPPGYGASVAAGHVPAPPTPLLETRYLPDGTEEIVNTRSGEVVQRKPPKTYEQLRIINELVPQYEREVEQAVTSGLYNKEEATALRARLAYAKVTGDVTKFQALADTIAAERGKERQANIRANRALAGAQPVETVTNRTETQPGGPIWRKPEMEALSSRLPDVVREAIPNFKAPTGPIKTPSGQTVSPQQYLSIAKQAIEQQYRRLHGVDVTVQWVPASGLNPFSGFSTGEWKIVRAHEPEKVKSSTTERKKGPPTIIPVPVGGE